MSTTKRSKKMFFISILFTFFFILNPSNNQEADLMRRIYDISQESPNLNIDVTNMVRKELRYYNRNDIINFALVKNFQEGVNALQTTSEGIVVLQKHLSLNSPSFGSNYIEASMLSIEVVVEYADLSIIKATILKTRM